MDGVFVESVSYVLAPNTEYKIVSPPRPGYTVDIAEIRDKATQDMEYDVHYVSKKVRLTIYYIYEDGTQAAETYTNQMTPGESYDVKSPGISGYTPSDKEIAGIMPTRDLEFTVIYVRPEGEIRNREDYSVNLGMGNINMNIGICIE